MSPPSTSDHAGVVAPAPVFFGIAVVAGFVLERLVPTSLLSFRYATATGLALIAASVTLVAFAVPPLVQARTAFDARRPTTSIVTSGAFRVSRNPTYLSLALLQLGLAFSFQSLWLVVTAAAAIAVTHWGVVLPEERYLERKFGEEYRAYAAKVRRWL
ncbi:MAG: isoprenylcysteine carboxylmethyltransferase family protein [Burkholderiaceae bacterium]